MRIHHIGYLVRNIEKAQAVFLDLGYTLQSPPCFDDYRGVTISFLKNDVHCIELVEPNRNDSVAMGLLKRYRNSPYHICYITTDLKNKVASLRQQGFMPLGPSAPAVAIQDQNVIFLVHPHIGIIELIEYEQFHNSGQIKP